MYSTGKSTQYSVTAYKGEESEKDSYIYIYDSLYCIPETNITMYMNYIPIKKF